MWKIYLSKDASSEMRNDIVKDDNIRRMVLDEVYKNAYAEYRHIKNTNSYDIQLDRYNWVLNEFIVACTETAMGRKCNQEAWQYTAIFNAMRDTGFMFYVRSVSQDMQDPQGVIGVIHEHALIEEKIATPIYIELLYQLHKRYLPVDLFDADYKSPFLSEHI